MTSYRKIKNRVRQSLRSKPIVQGVLGDGAGNVKVPGSSYQCYARVGDRKAPIIVTNLNAPMQDGLPVIIGEDRVNPGLRQVLGVNYYSGVSYPENPAIGAHSASHRYDGTDPVYLDTTQVLPLSVRAINDGLKVRVYSGSLATPTGAVWVAQTTIDMADHLPASGYSWNLVQVSNAGVVSVVEGTSVNDLFDLTYASIPPADGHNLALAAVRLSAGKTVFNLMFSNSDIRDLRLLEIRNLALDDLVDVNASDPGDGQVLTWDEAAGEWVASSSGAAGDSSYSDAYASRPAASNAGDLFLPNDGYWIERDTGAAWAAWGPLMPLTTPPTISNWTWVNQGTATATETGGGIYLSMAAGAGANHRILQRAVPTPPYVITAAFLPLLHPSNNNRCGILWRDSSSGKEVAVSIAFVTSTFMYLGEDFSNYSTYVSNNFSSGILSLNAPLMWVQFGDNNTNRYFKWSVDGQNFYQLWSESRITYCTPDKIGIFVSPENASLGCGMTLVSWKEA